MGTTSLECTETTWNAVTGCSKVSPGCRHCRRTAPTFCLPTPTALVSLTAVVFRKIATLLLEIESFFGDESEREDAQEFLVGSAIRALKASRASAKPFDRFILIDANPSSCTELRAHIESEFPEAIDNVSIECKDANIAIAAYLSSVSWQKTRALVFLDPYGLEVGWKTITRLAETKACDVWYLFPLGGVIRMMTNSGQIPQS